MVEYDDYNTLRSEILFNHNWTALNMITRAYRPPHVTWHCLVVRLRAHSGTYAESMAPPVLAQLVASMARVSLHLIPKTSCRILRMPLSRCRYRACQQRSNRTSICGCIAHLDEAPALRDGTEGHSRLRPLAFNSRYLYHGSNLRSGLKLLGW